MASSFFEAVFGGGAAQPSSSNANESAPRRGAMQAIIDEESPLLRTDSNQQQEVPTSVVKRTDTDVSSAGYSKARNGTADMQHIDQQQQQGDKAAALMAKSGLQVSNGSPSGKASTASTAAAPTEPASWLLPVAYGLTNLSSVVLIVFANKIVLGKCGFAFPVALTWFHTIATAAGMLAMAACSFFPVKHVALARKAPVAVVYVAFIVFNNLSIKFNTVGFYQISKIAITPVVVAIEFMAYGKRPSGRVMASIVVLLLGIAMATITDSQVASNPLGMMVAAANIFVTALYQVWAGTKQKELGLNGMQLLHQVSPIAVALLGVLIPALEPVGWGDAAQGTLLAYKYSLPSLFWIGLSSMLGLVVTLSTFLFIGVTSSLTYNVVGHLKTVAIVSGGVMIFGDEISLKKLAGLTFAMSGIVWYSHIKMTEVQKPTAKG